MSRPHVKPAWRTRDPVAHGRRRFSVGEFILHHLWYEHPLEWLWQQLDVAGQHEVMERPGIGDDQQHAGSEAEPLQVAAVALQIVCRVCAEDAVPGQKLIELGAGGETKQPAQFDPAEMPLPEFVER